jgi:hypothetical protein
LRQTNGFLKKFASEIHREAFQGGRNKTQIDGAVQAILRKEAISSWTHSGILTETAERTVENCKALEQCDALPTRIAKWLNWAGGRQEPRKRFASEASP